jgi:hypothetical protein
VPFYEFFDGDTGRGYGAAHQTGWTALLALFLARYPRRETAHAATAAVNLLAADGG